MEKKNLQMTKLHSDPTSSEYVEENKKKISYAVVRLREVNL